MLMRAIAGRLMPLTVAKKLYICREGELAEGIYILQSGEVRAYEYGGEVASETFMAPSYFGLLALF